MAVNISTADPMGLLKAIKLAIDSEQVRTWSYDTDGDFTHTAEQWKNKAWLRPREEEGFLILNILAPSKANISTTVYAVFHGRFIEMLLSHFDTEFKRASASAFPVKPDRVKA
jgi:hypothetical protein